MKFTCISYVISGDTMKKRLFQGMLISLFICLLWCGKINFEKSREALTLWFETLVPSMFCVLVLVRVIFAYDGLHLIAKPIAFLLSKPLNISKESFVYVIAMMLLGFPAGAAFINEEVKKGCLSKAEGKRLLYACSFATPGFIIMTLGNVVFHDIKIGILLFFIQIISGLILLFFNRSQPIHAHQSLTKEPVVFAKVLAKAIKESGVTLYMMGGYLMLCMSTIPIVTQFLPSSMRLPISVISEFSSGCIQLGKLPFTMPYHLILISMLLSFGGLCVHMQVICMSEEVSPVYRSYFSYRLLQVLISAFLCGGVCYLIRLL